MSGLNPASVQHGAESRTGLRAHVSPARSGESSEARPSKLRSLRPPAQQGAVRLCDFVCKMPRRILQRGGRALRRREGQHRSRFSSNPESHLVDDLEAGLLFHSPEGAHHTDRESRALTAHQDEKRRI